jgi:hypothetical protein
MKKGRLAAAKLSPLAGGPAMAPCIAMAVMLQNDSTKPRLNAPSPLPSSVPLPTV